MADDARTALVRKMVAEGTSDDDITAALKVFDSQSEQTPPAQRTWADTAKDVGIGVLKGVGSTVAGIGNTMANAGMIPGATPSLFQPEMQHPVLKAAQQATTATNTPQAVGKGLETAAEIALPAAIGASAMPTAAKAGAKFQDVMGAAAHLPIDVEAPGQVAMRIQELAQRGGSMPQAVRQFLGRITDPDQGMMTYEEARDFASNISRLSANETQRLTPVMAREVANMRVALNQSIADTAAKAGKGAEYAQAMTEYAKAMQLKNLVDTAVQGAQRAAPYMTGAGAGYWLTKKISGLLGGE